MVWCYHSNGLEVPCTYSFCACHPELHLNAGVAPFLFHTAFMTNIHAQCARSCCIWMPGHFHQCTPIIYRLNMFFEKLVPIIIYFDASVAAFLARLVVLHLGYSRSYLLVV